MDARLSSLRPSRARARPVATLVAGTLLAVWSAASAVGDGQPGVTVTRLEGAAVEATRLVAVEGGDLVLEGAERKTVRVALANAVAVAFPTPPDPIRPPSAGDVAVDLWSGEVLHGRIVGGSDESLVLRSPLLGEVAVAIDHLAGVRFLDRLAAVIEPPDFTPSDDPALPDTIHVVGGDRLRCTLASLSSREAVCATAASDRVSVPYDRMTALRLGRLADPPVPAAGISMDVVLRDGTRITGSRPSVGDGRLRLESISELTLAPALGDIVAVHLRSDAFRYLSGLPGPAVEVKPFWKLVEGSPEELYAPRMDRSFAGAPLRCDGRTWLRGIGVYSGTTLTFDLDGTSYREFRTHVGIDDGAGRLGGVIFQVLVDGELCWESGFVRAAGTEGRGEARAVDAGRIDVKGARTLTLRVLAGDEEDPYPVQDEADWLGAMLVR